MLNPRLKFAHNANSHRVLLPTEFLDAVLMRLPLAYRAKQPRALAQFFQSTEWAHGRLHLDEARVATVSAARKPVLGREQMPDPRVGREANVALLLRTRAELSPVV